MCVTGNNHLGHGDEKSAVTGNVTKFKWLWRIIIPLATIAVIDGRDRECSPGSRRRSSAVDRSVVDKNFEKVIFFNISYLIFLRELAYFYYHGTKFT